MNDDGLPPDAFDDVAVILLAAGSGERLGASRPKAFIGVAGEVMLAHSLRAFEAHEAVDSIVLVVPEDWVGPTEVLIDDLGCDKVSSLEVGASTRAGSVMAGLQAVAARHATAVLVHDAARPEVSADVIDRLLSRLADGADAVVPVMDVHDTIKRVDDSGLVLETIPRGELRAAQTPQCVRASVLIDALQAAAEGGDAALAKITDCAAAVEGTDARVATVAGDARSWKVTTADDLQRMQVQMAPPAEVVELPGALETDSAAEIDAEDAQADAEYEESTSSSDVSVGDESVGGVPAGDMP